jgi:AcrR family transcriptional regulator
MGVIRLENITMKRSRPQVATPRFNLMNQKMGKKGAATRCRILDATVSLVETQDGSMPSVSMICRVAEISKPTFYQYFEQFNDLVAELLRPTESSVDDLAALLAEDWPEAELNDRAYQFVTAFFDYWDRFHVPLRLRNLLADAGDREMIEIRLRSIDPVMRELADKIRKARGSQHKRREDHALAISIMHAVNSAAMTITHHVYPRAVSEVITRIHGYFGDIQQRSLAHLIVLVLQYPEFVVPNEPPQPA